MPDSRDQSLLNAVNASLDPRALADAIGYRTDRILAVGGTLKIPCMIHQDERFATLLLFPGKNTCKCMVATCRAHEEISLVELIGLHYGLTGIEAARKAVELTKPNLAPDVADRLAGDPIENAHQHLEAGDIDNARREAERAANRQTPPGALAALRAQLEEHDGKSARAAELWRQALDELGEPPADATLQRRALDALLKLGVASPEEQGALLACYEAEGATQKAHALRIDMARVAIESGDSATAITLLEEVHAAGQPREEVLRLLVMAHSAGHERDAEANVRLQLANVLKGDEALAELRHAARLLYDLPDADPQRLRGVYDRIRALAPDDAESPRAFLQHLKAIGQTEALAREALALAGHFFAAGDSQAAAGFADMVSQHATESGALRLQLADIYDLHDRRELALREVLDAARVQLDRHRPQGALELVAWGLEREPDNGDLRAMQVQALVAEHGSANAPGVLLDLAERLIAEGHAVAAQGALREVLRLDPHAAPAARQLARLLASGTAEEREEADALLVHLLNESADDDPHLVEDAQLLLSLAPDAHAIRSRLANRLLADGERAAAAREFATLGEKLLAAGNAGGAMESLDKALELEPTSLPVLTALAAAAKAAGHQDRHVAVSMQLAAAYVETGEHTLAADAARGVLESQPNHVDARLLLAKCLLSDHHIPEAAQEYLAAARATLERPGNEHRVREILTRVEKLRPLPAATHEALGRLYLTINAESEGLIHSLQALRQYKSEGNLAMARQLLDVLEGQAPVDEEILRLRVEVHEGLGENPAAIATLERLAILQARDAAGLRATWQRILQLDPARADIRGQLAEALAASEAGSQAAAEFLVLAENTTGAEGLAAARRATELAPDDTRAWLLLARQQSAVGKHELQVHAIAKACELHLARDQKAEAIAALESLALPDSALPGVHEHVAQLWLQCGREKDAASHYRLAADYFVVEQNSASSVRTMRMACDLQPTNATLRKRFAHLLLEDGQKDAAMEEFLSVARAQLEEGMVQETRDELDALDAAFGDRVEFRERVGFLYRDAGIPELAAQQYIALARLHKNADRADAALPWARMAVDIRPRDPDVYEALAEVHLKRGDAKQAVAVYKDLAELHADSGDLERARSTFQRLREIQPDTPEFLERTVTLSDLMQDAESAEQGLESLADLYLEREEPADALRALGRLVERRPEDRRLRTRRAELLAELGQDATLSPELVILARLHRRAEAWDEALTSYGRAVDLAPLNTDFRSEFLEFLIEQKHFDEALARAQELVEVLVMHEDYAQAGKVLDRVRPFGQGNADFHLAQAHVFTGQKARGRALQELDRASALYKERGETRQHIDTLRRAIGIDDRNTELHERLIAALREAGMAAEALEARIALVRVHRERGLPDLAEQELRAIIEEAPGNDAAWQALIDARLAYRPESEVVPEYLDYALNLIERGAINESLHYISRVIRLDPRHIKAREAYIDAYLRIGPEADLVNDYLVLAELLATSGRQDEASVYYSKVLALDPDNRRAKEKLTDTRAPRQEAAAAPASPIDDLSLDRPHETRFSKKIVIPDGTGAFIPAAGSASSSHSRRAPSDPATPDDFLFEGLDPLEDQSEEETLDQVIASYQDILAMNPQNANVRLKLAELFERIGKTDELVDHLSQASETLFTKGDLAQCVTVCERILKLRPTDQKVRLRLKQAFNKRDALKALESAIWFVDDRGETRVGKSTGPSGTS